MVHRLIFGTVDNCPMTTAMNIDRHSRKMDGDSLNNFTIEHYLNNNNSSTRDIMNNVINVRADGTHEFDAHSSPVIAPNEPNHNSKYTQNERKKILTKLRAEVPPFVLIYTYVYVCVQNVARVIVGFLENEFDFFPGLSSTGRLRCHCENCPQSTCITSGLCITSVEAHDDKLTYTYG